jgi:hypothetical protein
LEEGIMKRAAALLAIIAIGLLTAAPSAPAQTTATATATCQPSTEGVSTLLSGTITPVPQTEFDISIVSSVRGQVFHITLPAGFDITGAGISVGPAPLGRLTITVFQDLNHNDVRDPGEPILASTFLTSPCRPGPTRAEQCSNGAWRAFGFFNSQGDCVAFVTTGGSNEPGQNVPGPPATQGPESVTGSGSSSFCGGTFTVNAQSGPSGVTGQVTCGSFFAGPVTCLNVTGNVALLTAQTSQFGSVALRITDNGATGDKVEATTGSGCTLPQPGYIDVGFFGGSITVVDAAAT